MKTKTKKRTLFSLLAALLVGAGIGGHLSAPKTEVASADYIGMDYSDMTTSTTDHFLISGGSYTLGTNSANGIPMTVTPSKAGGDVTILWNGAYRFYQNPGTSAVGVDNFNARDVGFYSTGVNAKAMIHTFRSMVNPEFAISFVCTPKQGSETNDSMWIAFTDKISFREDGVPYITGTKQELLRMSNTYTNVMSKSEYYFFRLFESSMQLQIHDSWGSINLDADWFTDRNKYLPEDMKAKYTHDYIKQMLDVDQVMNYATYSMTFVGLQSETTQYFRWFDEYKFYTQATDGSYTMPLPKESLSFSKYTTLVSGVNYTLSDLLTLYPNPTVKATSDYPYVYGSMSELSNIYWATNCNGTNWSKPANNFKFTFNNENFLKSDGTGNASFDTLYYYAYFCNVSEAPGSGEFKGKLTFVDSGLISQKTTTLKVGQSYNLNDLFRWVDEDCNPFGDTKNYVSVEAYLSDKWGTFTAEGNVSGVQYGGKSFVAKLFK